MAKKFILIFLILICYSNSHGQSRTKKYNSLMERYEYFDENGTMVGYEKYNSLMGQWEYFETNNKRNSNNKYGEYIQPYDIDLINKTLAYKQNRYDNNVDKIQSKIDYINKFFQVFIDYKDNPKVKKRLDDITTLYESYYQGLNKLSNTNADYSRNSTARNVINWLNQYETRLTSIAREIEQDKSYDVIAERKSKPTNYIRISKLKYSGETNLKKNPDFNSPTIKRVNESEDIYIIKHNVYSSNYDEVFVNGYYGFILSKLIE